ncbi:1-deoxy-D-xylulose-5-phosphate reductoisomerase [Enterobacteriaceae endosymbiont of Macroplea mutica]|uniref:1-deoxy-D-xylulose-5-phosphate reductoisomerase n=1 Tax=Enterobacteriaceae endosymbiont of Macroplea mutica TaxID=2675791 RepID=UPI00144957CC|nr:1-deoxy-D-xylulose-5-phosphate reductoisomerase [Enterobacteriaceae endosymbiont of Macroplea mutica]QJC31255.1 1-deoxy-D-xylulose-5-phosphate reductoisomerase [Enterobacteriaceae endosymbiont of Macroplea mutica]
MKYLTILGSTGYFGRNILSVILTNPNLYKIKVLVAKHNVELMIKQCILFNPDYAIMYKKSHAIILHNNLKNIGIKTKILFGKRKIIEITALDDVDQIIITIKSLIGLLYIKEAIKSSKVVLLTSIELLIIIHSLLIKDIYRFKAKILPINNSHSAIYELMPNSIQKQIGICNLYKNDINSIILIGSGGLFLYLPIEKFKYIDIKSCITTSCLNYKNMINMSTMISQGFEYIATKYLFNAQKEQIEIIINPESIIAAMVRLKNNSVNAKLNYPNIQVTIASMLEWPYKINADNKPVNFYDIQSLTFLKPDLIKYPCLKLAIEASYAGLSAFIILNAVNDITTELCLKKKISFIDIAHINSIILDKLSFNKPKNIYEVLWIDNYVRQYTHYFIKKKKYSNIYKMNIKY